MLSIEEINNLEKLIEILGLDWTEEQKAAFLADIPKISLSPLSEPYPSKDRWFAESEGTAKEWAIFWNGTPLKDPRVRKGERLPILVLDREKLQHVVTKAESTIIEDAGTGRPCMVILRNFILVSEFLKAMDMLCRKNVLEKRDARVSSH